jgi:hypothetical protein
MKSPILRGSLMLFAFWLWSSQALSQNSDAPKPLSRTFLLQNCNVIKQPGAAPIKAHVLIRDGLIADVGPMVKPSFDAQIIKADSMYVYAGFIDGYSHTGIAKPENKERTKITNPGAPTHEQAGITPHLSAIESYKSSDKSVGDMRAAGFGAAQVAPRGQMLPGSSAVYLLGDGVEDQLLVKSNTTQNFALESARGVFPSSSIAVMAKFRDLMRNAKNYGDYAEKYKLNPTGMARPDQTPELTSLYPVTTKKQTLNVVTRQTKDLSKMFLLQKELGFAMNLVDVKQGWNHIDKIKANGCQVFLSLDLPEEEKVEKKDSTATKKDSVKIDTPKDLEKEAFDAKRTASNKEYLSQASVFEKNGIAFGFSAVGAKAGEIKKSIARLIKAGLSEQAALAALTTNPAKILGLSQSLGTVEKGKIANLVITDKSYFDEKSSIKYVFVDGQKYDYSTSAKKSDKKGDGKPSSGSKIEGEWSYSVSMGGQTESGTINIRKNGTTYSIEVKSDSDPSNVEEGKDIIVDGNKLSFHILADMGSPVKVDFDLEMDATTFKGTVDVPGIFNGAITGDRKGDPKY